MSEAPTRYKKTLNINSEAVLKDFSITVKQDMIEEAIAHQEQFVDDLNVILLRINQLTEQELLALYLSHHHHDRDIINELVQTQDDTLPF